MKEMAPQLKLVARVTPRAEKVKCQISRKNPLHAYTLKGTLKQLKLRKTFKILSS